MITSKNIFIIAGEASGDQHAANYVKQHLKINPDIKLKSFNNKLTKKNINQIANNFDLIVDGSDNFRTRFLINDYCLKNKKILISGAISKFD